MHSRTNSVAIRRRMANGHAHRASLSDACSSSFYCVRGDLRALADRLGAGGASGTGGATANFSARNASIVPPDHTGPKRRCIGTARDQAENKNPPFPVPGGAREAVRRGGAQGAPPASRSLRHGRTHPEKRRTSCPARCRRAGLNLSPAGDGASSHSLATDVSSMSMSS